MIILDYGFNKKGEIDNRSVTLYNDISTKKTETFDFDNLGRLNDVNGVEDAIIYSANGNILKKADVSPNNYTYGENNHPPHAVTGITNPLSGTVNNSNQSIEYNAFNKISSVSETVNGVSHILTYTYGADHLRRKTVQTKDGSHYLTKYFIGNYEREIYADGEHYRHLHYIPTPDGVNAVYITEVVNWGEYSTEGMYYLYTDYLGSIQAIADSDGNIVQQLSYDAWGRRRNPTDWDDYISVATHTGTHTIFDYTPFFIDRGYTSHQHLDDFALINMNGRVYDPVLGRFLSSDPYIQAPGLAQNYNRYSYVMNNPLHYNDPSGENPVLVAMAIGATLGAISGGIRANNNDDITFGGGVLRGAFVGAVGGALSTVGGGTFAANLAHGLWEGAITGGLDAALWGEDVGRGMAIGGLSGMTFAGITSGIEAYRNYNEYGKGFFRTNEGVINKYIQNGDFDDAIHFTQKRYGMGSVKMDYDQRLPDHGITEPLTGDVRIGPTAFRSPSLLKATMIHEYGHSTIDRVLDANGNFLRWRYPVNAYASPDAILRRDGPLGYAQEIYNAGKLKIRLKTIADPQLNPLWVEWSNVRGGSRFFHVLPQRYSNIINPIVRFY